LGYGTHDDAGEMGVENAAILVIFPVDLEEMGAEVLNNRFIVIRPVTEGSDAANDGEARADGNAKVRHMDVLFFHLQATVQLRFQ
jgi:hypothetical protein